MRQLPDSPTTGYAGAMNSACQVSSAHPLPACAPRPFEAGHDIVFRSCTAAIERIHPPTLVMSTLMLPTNWRTPSSKLIPTGFRDWEFKQQNPLLQTHLDIALHIRREGRPRRACGDRRRFAGSVPAASFPSPRLTLQHSSRTGPNPALVHLSDGRNSPALRRFR
jgi:hypothetical protein